MTGHFGAAPFLIAGPCVLESDHLNLTVAEGLAELGAKCGVHVVFKASFDKANRSRLGAARGPGLDRGLVALERVRAATGLPILTDVHEPAQVAPAAAVADVLQIPAFLCRQTDLLVAAGGAGRAVNVKKGQWMAPEAMAGAVEKLRAGGAPEIAVTERGTFFGYGDLVVDMRNFLRLRASCGTPVVFDATHAVQQPGQGAQGASGGSGSLSPRCCTPPRPRERTGFSSKRTPIQHGRRAMAPPWSRSTSCRGSWARLSRSGSARGRRCVLDPGLARRVKLVGFDVDGVLTDGGIFLGLLADGPFECKRFHVTDGVGVRLLRRAGLPVVFLSARRSPASAVRAKELEVDELLEVGPTEKLPALEGVLARRGVTLAECAYVGDDLADLPVLEAVGLPIAVANAAPEVKAAARYTTTVPGGAGAARQVAELLLKARGEWAAALAPYVETPSDARPSAPR